MELARSRLGLSLAASGLLHAALVAAMVHWVVVGGGLPAQPVLIQVDLLHVASGHVSMAPRLGPTRIAPEGSGQTEVKAAAPSPAPAPVDAPAEARAPSRAEPEAARRSKPKVAPAPRPRAPTPGPVGDQVAKASPSDASLGSVAGDAVGAGVGSGGSGPGSTAPVLGSAVRVRYEQLLYAWLARFKRYPLLAWRRGIEGSGTVRVRLDRKGHVLARTVERSTGQRVLDEAVLEMTRRADPFPPLPGDYSGDSFEFVAPIEFRLR